MDLDENGDFTRGLVKTGTPTYLRFVSRDSTGPDQARDKDGFFVTPFAELAERKLLELSDEKQGEYEAADVVHEKEARQFLTWVFATFVTVEKGLTEELEDGTEQSINKGLDFLRAFVGRADVISQVLEAVRLENSLDAVQKKIWRSPTASLPSSDELEPDPVGPKREMIVEPVASGDCAASEDATKSHETPSGSTETSRSILVPSSR